ncbi:major head protein [Moorella phage MTATph1]
MGSPEPRSFSRGKRGIAGSLVFVTFDRNALLDEMKKQYEGLPTTQGIQTFTANVGNYADEILRGALSKQGYAGIARWDEIMTELGYPNMVSTNVEPVYVDQLLPFDVTIHFANEYGQRAQIDIYGVEILNNGMGVSIDDVVTEQTYSFVARSLKELHHVG